MFSTELSAGGRSVCVYTASGEAGGARFSVLSDAIVRVEWDPAGGFEDRGTLAFPERRGLGAVVDDSRWGGGGGVLETADLVVRYDASVDGGELTAGSLSIEVKATGVVWRPGMENRGNLGGTIRTLDHVSGATAIDGGLVSREGWSVHDDSGMPVLEVPADGGWRGEAWAVSRGGDERAVDWYFFGHGRDYVRCMREFGALSGPIPLVPRYVLGVWWSRYWRYTDGELKSLVGEFETHGVPLDVLVIDMDWHLTGWTGYTWDSACFPDPAGFLGWCAGKGLRVTLNLHPADGVGKHEAQFNAMRAAVGGGREMYRVPFDCTDTAFVGAYFDLLHRPIEADGVDFWWMDWQQGTETAVEKLDPLPWLNHLHYRDMALNEERTASGSGYRERPLVFSRWGGLGGHRYPIGFSGDTYNDWASLAFQPGFTATAANVGFGYWSHDIGGHQPGPVEGELYARWIQYGVLSPVVRTHAGKRVDAERRVWAFEDEVFSVGRDAMRLRYELLPYIYGACRAAYDTGVSLCRPMYYTHPEEEAAYGCGEQYWFGDDVIAAPVVGSSDGVSGRSVVRAWLPRGVWVEWFTGRVHEVDEEGGRDVLVFCPLDEIPMFVRGGAVVPTAPFAERVYEGAVPLLRLNVFPGGDGGTRVYDDDGVSVGYMEGACAWTAVRHRGEGGARRVEIGAAAGSFDGLREARDVEVWLRESVGAARVTVDGEELARVAAPVGGSVGARGWWYDEASRSVVVSLPGMATARGATVDVELVDDAALAASLLAGERGRVRRRAALAGDGSLSDFCCRYGVAVKLSALPWGEDRVRVELAAHHVPDEVGLGDLALGVSFDEVDGYEVEEGSLDGGDVVLGDGASRVWWAVLRAPGGVPVNDAVVARVRATVGGETRALEQRLEVCPSLNGWWVVGPFPCAFEGSLDRVFGPEEELLETGGVDLSRAYPSGGDGGVRVGGDTERSWVWRQRPGYVHVENEYVLDLNEALDGPHIGCVGYAATTVVSPRAMRARMLLGSDDGVVVWVNGREVFRHHVKRGYVSGEAAVAVDLREGENVIVAKVSQDDGGWMVGVRLEDEGGGVVPGLRVEGRGVSGRRVPGA